ncbi:AGRF5 protein, partial [Podilymbus podiceps]|nr:AGRF5 protein [Podilymbus podiceps]
LTFDLLPLEYTIDIEVSLMNSSFLEPIKEYFKKLNLPVSTNISNVEMTISNINITTVCQPKGENYSCCSCEKGYAWPSAVCSDLITSHSVSLAPDLPCCYMKKMPFHGPYCEPQTEDSCGMREPIIILMSVRLDTVFHNDLNDSSSELYKKYKADLENAFNASYRCLPGFISAMVTGFRSGSVFVNYEVKAGAASFDQIDNSNKIVSQFLDLSYQLNQSTFTSEITNQTYFTVIPEKNFEGETVKLVCEINSTSENATWDMLQQEPDHFKEIIPNGYRYSIEKIVTKVSSKWSLQIRNITTKDSGVYRCTSTISNQRFHTLTYTAKKAIKVFPINITSNLNDIDVICNSPEMQKNGLLLSCCIDRLVPPLQGEWKVNGEINITGVTSVTENCTEYKLNINESLCPPEKSGTVTTYTCELQTGHGIRYSQDIRVTYLRAAHVTISSSTNSSVSKGYPFNLMCESDVSNYDSISWEIQSGNHRETVNCAACIKNSKFPATSVLTVETALESWSGTYICTFSQKNLESSANVTIEVVPLPLTENILIDPIVASILCKVEQALECCLSAEHTENYTVAFMVEKKEFPVEKKKKGQMVCYTYNYTETECSKEKDLTAYCRFINRIGQEVNSRSIKLQLITDKEVSCSGNGGIGIEGATSIKPCYKSNNTDFVQGYRNYTCSNKSWKLERDNCLSVKISNLLTSAKSFVNGPVSKANLSNFLENLKNETEKEQSTINSSPANLGAIINILDMVSHIQAVAEESTIQNFLSTVDLIVADSTSAAWDTLNKEKKNESSTLLQSVENFAMNLQPVNNTIPSVFANTLQLQGIVVTENSTTDYNKTFHSRGNLTVNVLIGETEIWTLTPNSTIISVIYSKLGYILPHNEPERVNGLVVTTTVSSNRSQMFNVSMTFAKENSSLKMPLCVFWNFTLNKHGGGWDTYGCIPTEAEHDVICSCNHLTSFSILMSPDKSSQVDPEGYISYIGLAISVLSLVACIIIESLVWKYVTNNTTSYMRHVCILNIAISLLIADIWFIVTASINDHKQKMSAGICFVATFFIHLFYLCVFFWMLSLGLILFYRLVFIFHNTSKKAQKALAFSLGYVCPFVIAVITIAVTLPRNAYTRSDICWLNWKESKALLAFVIPALIIVATNLFITAVVIIKILRPTIGDRSNRQERNSLFQIGKSVAILTPLLGLTWGFGLATIMEKSHQAFHILFSLLNAFQGLFILVFGTLWDKKIQEALLKRNSMSKWSSQQTKSTSLILVTPMLAMSYPFSRTLNNLCGKTGKYRVSSSEPSVSSSENTSKSYSLLN